MDKISRKTFLTQVGVISTSTLLFNACDLDTFRNKNSIQKAPLIRKPNGNEDIFSYIQKTSGRMDQTLYRQIIGAANDFKEGDLTLGIAAASDDSRLNARELRTACLLMNFTN